MIVHLHCNMVTNKTKKKLIIKIYGFRKNDLAVKIFIIKAKDGSLFLNCLLASRFLSCLCL